MVLGEITGTAVGAPLIDRVWLHLKEKANGAFTPEYRLPLMLPGTVPVHVELALVWLGCACSGLLARY